DTVQHLDDHGITTGEVKFDLAKMLARKDKVVDQLTGGIDQLLKGNGIEWLKGTGKLLAGKKVEFVSHEGETQVLEPKYVILATGSVPVNIPVAPVDQVLIVDSTGALEFPEVPNRLGVIGASVIGIEFCEVWSRLGAEVVVFEAMDAFLPMADKALAKDFQKLLTKQGMDIRIGAKVAGTEINGREVTVKYNQAGEDKTETFDKLIVCVGRRAYAEGLL